MRGRRKITWLDCPHTTEQSFSAEFSRPTTYYCLWCWGAPNCSYCRPEQLFTGAERLNRMCSKDWAAGPCFTPLQTSHKPVNKPTGGKRTALWWILIWQHTFIMYFSTALIPQSHNHTVAYKLAPRAQESCFLCKQNVYAEWVINCTTQKAVKWIITFQFSRVQCSVQPHAALTNCLENQHSKTREQRQQKLKEHRRDESFFC